MLLELFPIMMAVKLWGEEFKDRRLRFHRDNMEVVHAINSLLALSLPVVCLLRHLVLRYLTWNIVMSAVPISGVKNEVADALSRLQWDTFRRLAPEAELIVGSVPQFVMGARAGVVMSLVRRSVAESTWRSYERVWREWQELVSDISGCDSSDDRINALLYFLGRNCKEGVSVASLNSKMAGLAFLFKLGGVEDVTKDFIVRKSLRSYRKGLSRPDSRRRCRWVCWRY